MRGDEAIFMIALSDSKTFTSLKESELVQIYQDGNGILIPFARVVTTVPILYRWMATGAAIGTS
jgi:hypothetical protein